MVVAFADVGDWIVELAVDWTRTRTNGVSRAEGAFRSGSASRPGPCGRSRWLHGQGDVDDDRFQDPGLCPPSRSFLGIACSATEREHPASGPHGPAQWIEEGGVDDVQLIAVEALSEAAIRRRSSAHELGSAGRHAPTGGRRDLRKLIVAVPIRVSG